MMMCVQRQQQLLAEAELRLARALHQQRGTAAEVRTLLESVAQRLRAHGAQLAADGQDTTEVAESARVQS